MTIKEAILKSLEDLQSMANNVDIYNHIISHDYYQFTKGKTPKSTVSALLGDFMRANDSRIKRIKQNGSYCYYLSKYEQELKINTSSTNKIKTPLKNKNTYLERDLHKLLSSYLRSKNIFAKTIFHEQSTNNTDNHQKWIHPDIIGVNFLKLSSKANNAFIKALNKKNTLKFTSYEVKREINTDYELKKSYFQAVSNSSWANYGYLVAFEISNSLNEEMERLNQSFGIGIIELKANPYESKILFSAQQKELDFKTIDKLCKINHEFESFIELTEKILTAPEPYVTAIENELTTFCDSVFNNDSEIQFYCIEKNIPIENT